MSGNYTVSKNWIRGLLIFIPLISIFTVLVMIGFDYQWTPFVVAIIAFEVFLFVITYYAIRSRRAKYRYTFGVTIGLVAIYLWFWSYYPPSTLPGATQYYILTGTNQPLVPKEIMLIILISATAMYVFLVAMLYFEHGGKRY